MGFKSDGCSDLRRVFMDTTAFPTLKLGQGYTHTTYRREREAREREREWEVSA